MAVAETPKTFKDIQSEYNHLYVHDPIRDEDRAYQWHATQLLKYSPQARAVLDVACGGGYFLRELTKQIPSGARLAGIDISDQAIKLARKECPNASFSLSVGEMLPFQNNVFDAITCLGSLEHFLNIKNALGEMIRIVKNDGIIYILVPNMFWYKDIWSVIFTGDKKDRNQTQERFAPQGEWKRLFKECGLKVIQTIKYNGIARKPAKQMLKDILIPLNFSYHFVFICKKN